MNDQVWSNDQGVLTFGAEDLRGELQGLDVLGSNVLQGEGQLLGLAVKKLDGDAAGQFLFGRRLRRVGRPVWVRGGGRTCQG